MRNRYYLEDTNFIYQTNLSGEWRKEDRYPSNARTCNIIIPDPELVQEMIDDGFNVRQTKPNEGYEEDFVPEYFIKATLKYKSEGGAGNPNVSIVGEDGYSDELDEYSVGQIDHMRLKKDSVCATLSPYTKGEHPTLYIQALYVTPEEDHWSGRFPRRPR